MQTCCGFGPFGNMSVWIGGIECTHGHGDLLAIDIAVKRAQPRVGSGEQGDGGAACGGLQTAAGLHQPIAQRFPIEAAEVLVTEVAVGWISGLGGTGRLTG